MKSGLIIWLDDMPESVANQIVYCTNKGFDVRIVGDLRQFRKALDKSRSDTLKIDLFVIDILLYGTIDLSDLDIGVSTELGYEAGWALIEHFLRGERTEEEFRKVPILILTSRPKTSADIKRVDDLNDRAARQGLGIVKLLEKGGYGPDKTRTWDKEFTKLLDELEEGSWS